MVPRNLNLERGLDYTLVQFDARGDAVTPQGDAPLVESLTLTARSRADYEKLV